MGAGTSIAITLAIFLLIASLFIVVFAKMNKDKGDCIDMIIVCQERYETLEYNVALKMPMHVTHYRDVECNQPHDRKISRCLKYEREEQ